MAIISWSLVLLPDWMEDKIMKLPLQITFRNMNASEEMEANIRKKAEKLDRFYDQVMSCRIIVEAHHKHHHKGNLYHVRIDLTVPDGELEDYSRRRQQHVKSHQTPSHGLISQLHPEEDYGMIETPDGREIYFHRNSTLNTGFEKLALGTEVRFDEEEGGRAPQESTVKVIGKHHLID